MRGIRERRLYVFPGVHKAGVGLVVVHEGQILASAVGSVQIDYVGSLSERFHPSTVIIPQKAGSTYTPTPFRVWDGADIKIARSGWQSARSRYRFPIRHEKNLGPLAFNAWGMMAYELMHDRRIRIGSWNMALLSPSWLEEFAPRRCTNVKPS